MKDIILSPEGAAGPPSAAAPALRVLIVEDEKDIRESLQAVLELEGYSARAAADGPEALAALDESCPDAALLDIGLPRMDGYALARRIRERFGPDRLYLVALTGYGRPADRQAALHAGFDAHLTKPVKPPDLCRLLESLPRRTAGTPGGGKKMATGA